MNIPFDHLLAAHAVRAHRAALGLMGEEQEARDMAQEALFKAFRAQDRYDQGRPFYPWLYRIVKNTCLDAIARRKHRASLGLDEHRVADPAPSAEHRIDQDQAINSMRRAIQTLSVEHREIISMRHFQDLSYAEMSELLGVPQGTVMSRLYRARKVLARALEAQS